MLCCNNPLVREYIDMAGQQPADVQQLLQLLNNMQNKIAWLKVDLDTEKAVNLALHQKPQSKLPSVVKPALPPTFHSKMDGTSVSKFVHQLDVYFDLVDFTDDIKRGYIAVGLLEV